MTVIQEKPVKEVVAREPQSYSPALRVTKVAESDPTRYLRIALRLVGVAFIVGIYTLVNVWPSGWSWHAGQSHHLPHYLQMILGVYATLGRVSVDCEPQSARALKPYLVHGMVQRRARSNHGSTGFGEPGPNCTPLGRCPGTTCFRCSPCVSDATRDGSDRPCRRQEVNTQRSKCVKIPEET